jgi:hypothetical protein
MDAYEEPKEWPNGRWCHESKVQERVLIQKTSDQIIKKTKDAYEESTGLPKWKMIP